MTAGLVTMTAAAACAAILTAGTVVSAQTNPRFGYQFDPTILSGTGSLGVSVRDLTADEIRKAKLPQPGGVVATVADGSDAARAGFRNGDIVIEFDGERVRSARQFTRLVQESPLGQPVKALVLRDGTQRTIEVTPRGRDVFALDRPPDLPFDTRLGPFDRDLSRELGLDRIPRDTFAAPRRLGITLAGLTEQLGAYFGTATGVLVLDVAPRSAAETAGVKSGDVITAINGRGVRRPIEVSEAVRDAGNGDRLELKVIREKREMTLTAQLPRR
jgi:serine protease Do